MTFGERLRKLTNAFRQWVQGNPEKPQSSGGKLEGRVDGLGAVAQDHSVGAGAGGVAVGGNVDGGIHINSAHTSKGSELALRTAYLNRFLERCGYLSLAGIDPAAATGQRDASARLRLNAVYTALLTRSPRQEKGMRDADPRALAEAEKLSSALEQLDRNKRLVLQGDPGSGKSTFVNFVALCLAGEVLGNDSVNLARLTVPLPDEKGEDSENPQPWNHEALLPVPVVLPELMHCAYRDDYFYSVNGRGFRVVASPFFSER